MKGSRTTGNGVGLPGISRTGAAGLVAGLALFLMMAAAPVEALASYPGKNGRIFYLAQDAAGVRQVFSVNPNGSNRRRVTNERFGVLSLAVSPRGERIAYTRPSAAGEINIYSARGRDGKARRKLTSIPASRGFANSPTFSANGRLIAYEMADPVSGRSARLMVMRSNGRGKRVLARVPGFYLEDPAFSPNGRRVAYTVVLDFDVADRQIETARVSDGKGRRLVVAEQAADDKSFVQPDYSPNGEKIAFISNPDFLLDRNLLMNTAAAGRAPLRQLNESAIDFDYSHPVYSPDGRRILMVQTSRLFDVPSELVRVNRDGSGLSLVLRANLLDYPIWVRR